MDELLRRRSDHEPGMPEEEPKIPASELDRVSTRIVGPRPRRTLGSLWSDDVVYDFEERRGPWAWFMRQKPWVIFWTTWGVFLAAAGGVTAHGAIRAHRLNQAAARAAKAEASRPTPSSSACASCKTAAETPAPGSGEPVPAAKPEDPGLLPALVPTSVSTTVTLAKLADVSIALDHVRKEWQDRYLYFRIDITARTDLRDVLLLSHVPWKTTLQACQETPAGEQCIDQETNPSASHAFSVNLGDIAHGYVRSRVFVVRVASDARAGTVVRNHAHISLPDGRRIDSTEIAVTIPDEGAPKDLVS